MKEYLPTDYLLYEAPFQTGIPTKQLFVHYFNCLPSRTKLKDNFSYGVVEYLKSNGYKIYIKSITKVNRKNKREEEILLINEDEKIMIEILYDSSLSEDKESLEISLYYNILLISDSEIKIIDEINKKFAKKERKCDIKLLKNESGYLDTEDFKLKIPTVDIELNYGAGFKKIHDVIINRLNTIDNSGIVFLHGDPGTGKTTYIKYLTSLIEVKEVIFVPPSTAEVLSEPSIIPFLMSHKNSILVIEDSEKVISDRQGGGSLMGVSNILNLTDGILGDCLNIQIIATFNMNKEKIDRALLRKGRLIAEHKFTELSIEDSNRLLKHLGKNEVAKTKMSLADIYNIDTEDMREEKTPKKLGFN